MKATKISPIPPTDSEAGGRTYNRGFGKFGRPTYNQATKIIRKFGGEQAFAEALNVARTTPYRWQYGRPYGTDGLIPGPMIDQIKREARIHGVLLTDADWAPERIDYDTPPAGLPGLLTD